MPTVDLAPSGVRADSGFEVALVDERGEYRLGLSEVWAAPVELCRPVRGFCSYKGQRHHVGRWWSATTRTLVGYESWLERDRLILLDFDPGTVGIASQPFWLFWTSEDGRARSHVPDYFARMADGFALVVDCRPVERIKPQDRVAFEATRSACELVGWRYELVGSPPGALMANVRWLAAYRHPRHDQSEVVAALRVAFAVPTGLMEGAAAAGDPVGVLPVLFHLLWRGELCVDLSRPMHPDALITRVTAPTSGVVGR